MSSNERRVMGIIFANMHDSTIPNLTQVRTMASVPFGGRYRLIDFPLSSFVNAGIVDVGLITKANYQSLMDHVGSGREWDLARKKGGLHILPPYGNKNYGIYHGKLEALGAALNYLKSAPAKTVVMSDCGLIANIDLSTLLKTHKEKNADMTILYHTAYLSNEEAKDSAVVSFDNDGRLKDIMCQPDISGELSYSMNVIAADRDFLIKMVTDSISRGEYRLERDFLQKKAGDYRIFGCEYKGFVRKIASMTGFYQANIDLLNQKVRKELFVKERPIYTKVRDEAPVKYGLSSNVKNSFVADGCIIEGEVENSIIFRGCKIAKGASVKNCILMQDTVVGEKCELLYAMTDKQVRISDYRTVIATSTFPTYIPKNIIV